MFYKFTFLVSICMFFIISHNSAQVSTKLASMIVGTPTNSSGLGYRFQGEIMSDGYLYFRGSGNGLQQAIWKTKGTPATTSKVIEEASTFGSDWDYMMFLKEGVLVKRNNEWLILEAGKTSFRTLNNFPTTSISYFAASNDGQFYFTTNVSEKQILYITDLQNTKSLGEFHPNQSNMELTAGLHGAVIYNTNSFVTDFPKIYLEKEDMTMDVTTYLSQWFTVSNLTYAYIVDKFLIVSFKDNQNFFRNNIINMDTKEVKDFPFTRSLVAHYHYNDNIFLVSESDVIKISKSTMENKLVYDEVYSFTTSLNADDKLYVIGEGGTGLNSVVQIDMNTDAVKVLNNAPTGESFYSNRFEVHQGNFYYIQNTPTNQVLNRYNFTTDQPKVVDTLSTYTGATVEHGLVSLGDKLVISKRVGNFNHELYVLNNTTAVTNLKQNIIEVEPTITQSILRLKMDDNSALSNSEVLIYGLSGTTQIKCKVEGGMIDVSSLLPGKYVGMIMNENIIYKFSFVKI